MARLRLIPQKREFFDLYSRASANTVEISSLLVELLERFPAEDGDLIVQIKEREHEGDHLTHEVVDLLNRTFVTPFDRDDMYRLAGAIDDVCDHVDEAAGNVATYAVSWWKLTTPDKGAWAYAAQSTPSLTLQTCVGAQSQYRLIVRLRKVS